MDIKEPIEENLEKPEERKREKRKKKIKKFEMKMEAIEPETKKIENKGKEKPALVKTKKTKEKWLEPEGELAIDVYQTENELIVQSAIAGVKVKDLDISIENDIITIRGNRERPLDETSELENKRNYFIQECYWGPFSRKIIPPVEIDPTRAKASMEDGILTIKMPKIERERKRKIEIEKE